MGYGIGKRDNVYALLVKHIDAPKTVWMAIAVSLEMQRAEMSTPNMESLTHNLMAEWQTLHDNGIVPQQPRKTRR